LLPQQRFVQIVIYITHFVLFGHLGATANMQFATLLKGVAFLASTSLVRSPLSNPTSKNPLTQFPQILSANIPVRDDAVSLSTSGDSAPLESRGFYQGRFCIKDGIPGQNWDWIDISSGYIDQAIALIDSGGPDAGNFVSGAGPAYCGQITCVDRSAVYWCNDVSPSHSPQPASLFSTDSDSLKFENG
jgi:hypothetical protein